MLKYLDFTFVGPAPHMRLEFAPRLNLLTGDNSLGKTFVLDAAWWALTQTWPGKEEKENMAWPLPDQRGEASIASSFSAKTAADVPHVSRFDVKKELWPLRRGRPGSPGLVLYLRIDGGFSLWDPARNYWRQIKSRGVDDPDRPKAFQFNMQDIWDGLRANGNVFCEGLLADWKTWKDRQENEYKVLCEVLHTLSPDPQELMEPGEPVHISLGDVREIPTLRMPYGVTPVTLASAAIKRVLALAYLIAWAHTKHLDACKLIGAAPEDRFTVLIDEVELHLHPQWQRVLLPAVLKVIQKLGGEGAILSGGIFPHIQLITSTHAPLVMASIEPFFSEETDKVFHLRLDEGNVVVEDMAWAPQGDAVGWLVSDVFGLHQARSKESEEAIRAAEAYMRGEATTNPEGLRIKGEIDARLKEVVPGHDAFWARWVVETGKPQ